MSLIIPLAGFKFLMSTASHISSWFKLVYSIKQRSWLVISLQFTKATSNYHMHAIFKMINQLNSFSTKIYTKVHSLYHMHQKKNEKKKLCWLYDFRHFMFAQKKNNKKKNSQIKCKCLALLLGCVCQGFLKALERKKLLLNYVPIWS